MPDPTPPDSRRVPDPDPHHVPRTVSFSTQPDGCTAVRYAGGKIGRPVVMGHLERPRAKVFRSLRELGSNRERYTCLNRLGVVWTQDDDLVEELLCDDGTAWEISRGRNPFRE